MADKRYTVELLYFQTLERKAMEVWAMDTEQARELATYQYPNWKIVKVVEVDKEDSG